MLQRCVQRSGLADVASEGAALGSGQLGDRRLLRRRAGRAGGGARGGRWRRSLRALPRRTRRRRGCARTARQSDELPERALLRAGDRRGSSHSFGSRTSSSVHLARTGTLAPQRPGRSARRLAPVGPRSAMSRGALGDDAARRRTGRRRRASSGRGAPSSSLSPSVAIGRSASISQPARVPIEPECSGRLTAPAR